MGSLFAEERARRVAVQEKAMLVLMLEATAARVGGGDPPGQDGWRDEDAVLPTPVPMGPQTPAPRGTQPPAENFPQQPDLARAQTTQVTKKKTNKWGQNTGQGCAGAGAIVHASEFPRSTLSQTNHKKRPQRGSTAVRTADAASKLRRRDTARGPPTPKPGRKGGVEGRD